MQDLNQYAKRDYIAIKTGYLSYFAAGSAVLVGLVFVLGVLLGSRQKGDHPCSKNDDPLAALDKKSNEPAPPPAQPNLSFHQSLLSAPEPVPIPASLHSQSPGDPAAKENVKQMTEESAAIKPALEEPAVLEKVEQGEPGYYSLQVGSFQSHGEAMKMSRMLQKAGHKVYLVSANMPDRGGVWFRVRVGPFLTKQEVWKYKKQFELAENIPAFIVKRRTNG